MAFADTSFLYSLYREQGQSAEADRIASLLPGPLIVSSLVLFEFRQSARLQVFRFSNDRTQGFSAAEAKRMLSVLQKNLDSGALVEAVVDWPDSYNIAEDLSGRHTARAGFRAMDILHVATALHLGAREFLTFDTDQGQLAGIEGLTVLPAVT